MAVYVLREGQGKAVALYTRCEDELLAKAELLLLLEQVTGDYYGHPVWGFLDVEPGYTIERFKRSYRGRSSEYRKLMSCRDRIIREGWHYRVPPDDEHPDPTWKRDHEDQNL